LEVGVERFDGSTKELAGAERCFRRVKKMTINTVHIPNTEPITGPAIQTDDNVAVLLAAADGSGVAVGVAVGVMKFKVLFKREGAGVIVAVTMIY
jgi:hypothetical protein